MEGVCAASRCRGLLYQGACRRPLDTLIPGTLPDGVSLPIVLVSLQSRQLCLCDIKAAVSEKKWSPLYCTTIYESRRRDFLSGYVQLF
ncbi:hypothetical protein ACOMHN_066715 [Nucella lapillus]